MMKKALIPVLATLALGAVAAPSYAAVGQPRGNAYGYEQNRGHRDWQSINQRQAQLDRRIDQGVRNGTLSRREAIRLRSEFRQIAMLEAQYRRSGRGLDNRERADLDRRFDRLSAQIRAERRDRDDRRGDGRRY